MKNLILLFSLVCIFSSCVNAQKKALDRVIALETKLKEAKDASANVDLAKEVLEVYSEFLEAYPQADNSPEILYKSGEVLRGLNQHLQAAQVFHKLHTKHPKSKLAPLALFQQADCFEALGQRLTAKNTYEEFIERYPKHPYVEQALGMIQLLHYSDEELIKQFQK